MKIDLATIAENGFRDFQELFSGEILQALLNNEFDLYLVGGAVRDHLLFNKTSTDIDIEIHSKKYDSLKSSLDNIKKIFKAAKVDYEKLPYEIFRYEQDGFQVELSFPRLESFPETEQPLHHRDLKVESLLTVSLEKAFQRRDFTLNAMAYGLTKKSFQVKEIVFYDPYNAIDSLDKKELQICGDDFFKDPVRLLRYVRFSLKTDLELPLKTKEKFQLFNLQSCSHYYLLSEYTKSQSSLFIEKLFALIDEYKIAYPKAWEVMRSFSGVGQKEVETGFYSFWVKNKKNDELLENLVEVFSLKKKTFKTFESIDQSLDKLSLNFPYDTGLQLSDETIAQLLKIRSLLKYLRELECYHITKAPLEQLTLLNEAINSLDLNEEDYMGQPQKLRWTIPILKGLAELKSNVEGSSAPK